MAAYHPKLAKGIAVTGEHSERSGRLILGAIEAS